MEEDNLYDEFGNYIGPELENMVCLIIIKHIFKK
jgi:hypothetical protein